MLREVAVRGAIGVIALAGIAPATAHGAILSTGLHRLHNAPAANDIEPPPYGARLDELYDATLGVPDDFTFDFDYTSPTFSALMLIDVQPTTPGRYTLTIAGKAWGGRDIGGVYANDQYRGEYEFYFQYLVGVKDHYNGDDDIIVDPMDFTDAQGTANTGWVKTPLGDTIPLADDKGLPSPGFSLRIGDEDDDLGHDGETGISGWGWLKHGSPLVNHPQSDWIFTVDPQIWVPTPGSLALCAVGAVVGVRRRRRDSDRG